MEKQTALEELYARYTDFKKSSLYILGAQSIVFGEGNPYSPIVFIGEAPGAEEEQLQRPFVGRSGKLLTKTVESCGVKRKDLFITNIVKCRPPENRTPTVQEIMLARESFLDEELVILAPQLIVAVGLTAAKGLLNDFDLTMGSIRGKVIKTSYGPVLPIYHPAYILRNPAAFDIFYADISKAIKLSGMLCK